MNITEKNKAMDDLELLIDRIQLTGLCDLLAEVCSKKDWDEHAAFFINCSISPDKTKIKQVV